MKASRLYSVLALQSVGFVLAVDPANTGLKVAAFTGVGVSALISILLLILYLRKRASISSSSDIEKQSLLSSPLLEGAITSYITVSPKSCANLLGVINPNERLAWAHQKLSPGLPFFVAWFLTLSMNLCGLFLAIWVNMEPKGSLLGLPTLFLLIVSGMGHIATFIIMRSIMTHSVIYAVTNNQVLVCDEKYDGTLVFPEGRPSRAMIRNVQPISLVNKDGLGTLKLNFGESAVAFENIPNVSTVQDLFEQLKKNETKQSHK